MTALIETKNVALIQARPKAFPHDLLVSRRDYDNFDDTQIGALSPDQSPKPLK